MFKQPSKRRLKARLKQGKSIHILLFCSHNFTLCGKNYWVKNGNNYFTRKEFNKA